MAIRTIEKTTTRKGWRGNEITETTQYTEITGVATEVTNIGSSAQQYRPLLTIDAGDGQTATVKVSGQLARTTDGTERGLPVVGEQVTILALEVEEGSSSARTGASHTTIGMDSITVH